MAERQFTGYHMIGVLVLFFGTIITVNLIMAYYANTTWSGLVVKNSYVASQNFNEEQAIKEAHAKLGWKTAVAYEGGEFLFTIADKDGKPVAAKQVTAKLLRPANEAQDQSLILAPVAPGEYKALTNLLPGQWVVEVFAEAGLDSPYRHAERIIVKPSGDKAK